MRVLNLGSGKREATPDAVAVDVAPGTKPDVLHDLNSYPWPFDDEVFDAVQCLDVLEHLDDIVRAMEEIHRVSKPGGRVYITTPHFSCANSYTDPTHRHHLGFFSFDYFTGENQWDFYTTARFRKIAADLVFSPKAKNKLVWRLAKRWPAFYEEHLAWILPAWYIHFVLEVVK